METETVTERIERWKNLAESFVEDNTSAYIRDDLNSFYFAKILLVGETKVSFQCFGPEKKAGINFTLRWAEIIKFTEYKPEVGK